ncbi:hypothetical protein BDQ17DRAFT_1333560 [Cyathus striatus]|nr:hypothetical protein BDQ17DRAFT_1333560 [Cyathus striatus]
MRVLEFEISFRWIQKLLFIFLYIAMSRYLSLPSFQSLLRSMPRVVEPTFIAYDLQATFYEVHSSFHYVSPSYGRQTFVDRQLGDSLLGGHWRAAELICVEHMVHWRGRWRDAESVRVEQRRKTKRKNAKKGNGRKTKMKEEARHPGVVAL